MERLFHPGQVMCVVALAGSMFFVNACAKNAPEAATAVDETLPPVEESSETWYVEGVPGSIMVNTFELVAEVVAVNQAQRLVTLRGPGGKELPVRVGRDAVNFYQIAVGDYVTVSITEQIVSFVSPEDESQSKDDVITTTVAASAEGDLPAAEVVDTIRTTGVIIEMNLENRTAEIRFADGEKRTFNVRPDIDMTLYTVGQEVVFIVTEKLALSVEKS